MADLAHSRIERKRRYLAHLPEITDNGILRVALADTVRSARSMRAQAWISYRLYKDKLI